jgi:AcrR family transcriptional regulator
VPEPVQSVRPPRQRRSRESYERVLAAAHELLEDTGFEGFTIQDVAQRAGVSVGAIYERFANKETLQREVHARMLQMLSRDDGPDAQRIAAMADGAGAITAAVEAVARQFREHRRILRAFMHLGAIDEVIAQRGSRGSIELGTAFKTALLAHRERFTHADPEVAVDVAYRIAYCTFARQIMYGPVFESDLRIGWKRLTDEVAAACVAYLIQ